MMPMPSFFGMAYSLFPYLVPGRTSIWQGAAAPELMLSVLCGPVVVMPAILAYTVFAYRVFWGKATALDEG